MFMVGHAALESAVRLSQFVLLKSHCLQLVKSFPILATQVPRAPCAGRGCEMVSYGLAFLPPVKCAQL